MNVKLLEFIKGLKSEKKHVSLSEEATKMKYILAALSHLGWSTYNLDEVYPEHATASGRVDYALRHKNTNKVFIEAKKVGEPLEKHQPQLLKYSFEFGVKIAILTNGLTWWFYLPLHEGGWEQRRFYTIEINDQDAEVIADKFDDFLSQENVTSGKAIANAEAIYKSKQRNDRIKGTLPKAWEKLVSEQDKSLVDLISETTEKLCGLRPEDKAVKKFIASELKPGKVIITPKSGKPKLPKPKTKTPKPVGPKKNYTGKSIQSFTFQGTRHQVKSWRELLTSVCAIMAANHKDSFEDILNLRGKKLLYFSKKPDQIKHPRQIEDTDIYVSTHWSAAGVVRICIKVIALFGYKPGDLSIETT